MTRHERTKYFIERVGAKRRAKISFGSEEEIERIKNDQTFKLNERNALGVKSSEGWVYNLNIGNIMHLQPLDFDEMHVSFLPENISKRTNIELSRDAIVEKIVYLTVAYFCVGTEYRFLNSKIDQLRYHKKDSEMWHAKALHVWSAFMPSKSPLVNHITKSYMKHHLRHKEAPPQVEERKMEVEVVKEKEVVTEKLPSPQTLKEEGSK